MENLSLSSSTLEDLPADSVQPESEREVARLLRIVGEQNDTLAALQAMLVRVESERNGAEAARDKALLDASSQVSELGTLIDTRGREVERLQKELSDHSRMVASLQSSLRAAERDKDVATAKLFAIEGSVADVKRAYDSRALALEQSNRTLLRNEADALERAKTAGALADVRKEEIERSQQVMAQTFRDSHGLQTAYYSLQLESQRTTATTKADLAHALDMRRSLEERIKVLNEECKAMRQQQAETAHHLSRLSDSITLNHQTQISRFDTAVAYLGSLLKSPFVRWSLLWQMRRAAQRDLHRGAANASDGTSAKNSDQTP